MVLNLHQAAVLLLSLQADLQFLACTSFEGARTALTSFPRRAYECNTRLRGPEAASALAGDSPGAPHEKLIVVCCQAVRQG
jgi:hypothetical protein